MLFCYVGGFGFGVGLVYKLCCASEILEDQKRSGSRENDASVEFLSFSDKERNEMLDRSFSPRAVAHDMILPIRKSKGISETFCFSFAHSLTS